MRIGILALQGGFSEHDIVLKKLNVTTVLINNQTDLKDLNGIILPGGESTTIGMLLKSSGLYDPLRKLIIESNIPVWGTCAGFILLCEKVKESDQILLGGLPLMVERNAFGRQINSFVQNIDLDLQYSIHEFPGVFIRAPKIILSDGLTQGVKIFAKTKGNSDIVGVIKDDRIIGTSFHPELTNDTRMHQYFIDLISNKTI